MSIVTSSDTKKAAKKIRKKTTMYLTAKNNGQNGVSKHMVNMAYKMHFLLLGQFCSSNGKERNKIVQKSYKIG